MEADTLTRSWLQGRAKAEGNKLEFSDDTTSFCEKARRAYQWVINNAIYPPYFDVEYGTASRVGIGHQKLWLTDKDSYASFALLPVLTLLTSQRLLFIWATGSGKDA